MKNNLVAMSAMSLMLSMSLSQTAYAEDVPAPAQGDAAKTGEQSSIAKPNSDAKNDDTELKEVIVTATTTAQLVTDAPATVSVVTAKDLANKNVTRVDEALSTVAGVNVQNRGDGQPSNSSNMISLRGYSYYNQTAVLVDGQAINDAFTGAVDASMLTIDNIKQIEVVPGPFSALYGGLAMGGVVNIITKAPEKQELNISGSIGTNSTQHEAASYGDRWNLSQGGSIGLLVSADHGQSNGYVNGLVTTTSQIPGTISGAEPYKTSTGATTHLIGDQGKLPWLTNNYGAKLYLDLSPAQQLVLGISYHDGYTSPGLGNSYLTSNTTGATVTSFTGVTANLFLGIPTGQDSLRYTADYTAIITDDLKLKVKACIMDDHYWYESTTSTSTSTGGAGYWVNIPSRKNAINTSLEGAVGQKNFLVGGIYFEYDDMFKTQQAMSNWLTVTQPTGQNLQTFDGYSHSNAAYLQDQFDFNEKLTFYVGGREDFWETNGTETIVAGGTMSPLQQTYASRTDSAFNPKASAVYKLDSTSTLHTSWGTAFRAPQINEMYSPSGSSSSILLGNPTLQPEIAHSWEVGAEHNFPTQTNLRVTYYASDVTNLIASASSSTVVPGYTTVTQYQNIASVGIHGVETELRQKKVFADVDAFVNFTYDDSLVTSGVNNGTRAPASPQRLANIGLQGNDGKIFGSLTASYKDKAYGPVSGTTTVNTDTNTGVFGSYDAYTIVNAQVGYQLTKEIKATLAVNNLLDRTYFQYYEMPGRTYTFRLAAKF